MCDIYFRDSKVTPDDMEKIVSSEPHRKMLGEGPGNKEFVLEIDLGRKVDKYRVPVIVEGMSTLNGHEHFLVWDKRKLKWFISCGKVHFEWCPKRRYG